MSVIAQGGCLSFDPYMARVSEEIQQLIDAKQPITLEVYESLLLNSYECALIYPLFTDEALIHVAVYIQKNCKPVQGMAVSTYDEAAVHILLPELIKRLKDKL